MGNATKIFYVALVPASTLLQNHCLNTAHPGSTLCCSSTFSTESDQVYHCTDEPVLAVLFIGDAYPQPAHISIQRPPVTVAVVCTTSLQNGIQVISS